jgi:hypothetical protein
MSIIVTDERRGNRPKSARPFGIALGSPLDVVAPLVHATSPAVAPRLASGLPKAITMLQSGQDRLKWPG